MSQSSKPAVVLLSGGVDSTVLLYHIVRDLRCRPVHAISFNYGQRHAKEIECARWQAARAGTAEHRVIDLAFLGELLEGGSALIAGGQAVPDLDDLEPGQLAQPPTYVPNRNMMLLAVTAAYAETNNIRDVYYGAQAQDEYGYWDCTVEFLARLNSVLALNRKEPVAIHAPFVKMRKAETVKKGIALGVDFGHTWTCYRGGEKACGVCPTCVERLNAFRDAGAPDPLPYEQDNDAR